MSVDGDDIRDDDTILDELVHKPEPELYPLAEAVPKIVSVSPSVSVVPTPTPTRLSPAVLSLQQLFGL